MNRILVDKDINELVNAVDDKMILDIKNDINLKLDKNEYETYVFNIYESNVNVYVEFDKVKCVKFIINAYSSNVSFNTFLKNPSMVNMDINLKNKNAEVVVHNTTLSSKDSKYDIMVNHDFKDTKSFIYNNGITKEEGSIMYDVKSFVKKGKTNCVVNQDSKIVALNKNNKNKINPVLLIDEYTTEAKHAAFVGDFNNNELFYLQSRGLTKKEAQNLLINGLLIGTLDISSLEKEMLKDKINEF